MTDGSVRAVGFGRVLGPSRRTALLVKYDLRTRRLIGNTSMDPELSLIMANMALAAPGGLALDPFCGAGSMLFTCAEFGALVLGSDLNAMVLRGWGKTSRAKVEDKRRSAGARGRAHGGRGLLFRLTPFWGGRGGREHQGDV